MWCPPFLVAPPMWWWELDNIRSYVRFIIEMFCVHGKANSWFVISPLRCGAACRARQWPLPRDRVTNNRDSAAPPASVRDSNTWPWHRPRTRRMHHWPHQPDTGQTRQINSFNLSYYSSCIYRIREITHFKIFPAIFSDSFILVQQGAKWVLI